MVKGLNFKDWEKISSDKKSTTLQHKNGHVMTIAHGSLPRIQQEQLLRLKMAGGGKVKGVHQSDEADDDTLAGDSPAGTYARTGSKVQDSDKKKLWNHAAKKEHQRVLGEMKDMRGQNREYLDEGGMPNPEPNKDSSSDDTTDTTSQSAPAGTTININAAAPAPPVPPQEAPPQKMSGGASSSWAPPTETPPPTSANPQAAPVASAPLEKEAKNTLYGVDLGVQAANEQAKIDAEKSKEAATVEGMQADNAKAAATSYNNALKDVSAKADAFKDYINKNPINPNAYLENMGTEKKVRTAIGLLIGGFAGNGRNPALDFLNKQIDRDVAAQQQRAENQKTIFGAYQKIYDDQHVATKLATASTADMYAHQIAQFAAQQGTAQSAANAKASISGLIQRSTKDRMDAAGLLSNKQIGGQTAKPSGPVSEGPVKGTRILNPNAQNIMSTMQYHPEAAADLEKAKQQFTLADQADKALTQLDTLFPNLAGERTLGGWMSRNINPHTASAAVGALGAGMGFVGSLPTTLGAAGIPAAMAGAAAGSAAGEGLGQLAKTTTGRVLGGQQNTKYESDKASMFGLLSGVLKGIVGDETLHDIVEKDTPEYWDDQKTIDRKKKNFQRFIIDHVPRDVLERRGMTIE